MSRAYFIRKPLNIYEVETQTESLISQGRLPRAYQVRMAINLDNKEYQQLLINLSDDCNFLVQYTHLCGPQEDGTLGCILVRNIQNGKQLLINSEGYSYPRYVALPIEI